LEAIKWWRKAVDQNLTSALNNLAWLLATSPDSSLRDGPNAVALAEKAVAASNRKVSWNLGTLAAAYAEIGQFEKAVSTQREAIALLQTETEEEKNDFRSRLKFYESKKPYRTKE
jgi:hypothetical protein